MALNDQDLARFVAVRLNDPVGEKALHDLVDQKGEAIITKVNMGAGITGERYVDVAQDGLNEEYLVDKRTLDILVGGSLVRFSVLTIYPITNPDFGIYTIPAQMSVGEGNGDSSRCYLYDAQNGSFNQALTAGDKSLWDCYSGVFFKNFFDLDPSIREFQV